MDRKDFLKKQHLSVFEEKRQQHKEFVSNLYCQFMLGQNAESENLWMLFSDFYKYFSENFSYEIYDKELIVGTNWHWRWQGNVTDLPVPLNGGHFIADFEDFLKKGIKGKLDEINNHPNKASLETALYAFSNYIKKYADTAKKAFESSTGDDKKRLMRIAEDCSYISENPPDNFRRALQFIWFVQSFLNMESGKAAISFGRADSYLYPYYKKDIEDGMLTQESAQELIMCFYIKVSEGDESCMLTVGGDVDNELTKLFIDAQTCADMRQPSIAVRVSRHTSDDVLKASAELVLNGGGMPAYFNDDVIAEGLKMLGVTDEKAMDYGIVGCYEAAPQGVFSNTVASAFGWYESFDEFLNEERNYSSFDEFLKAYKSYFDNYYKDELLPVLKDIANADRNRISPFACCVLNREKYFFGMNILGTGVLIDSLYVIKKLVYDEKYTTIKYLKEQAEKDFEDSTLYNKIIDLKGHYGSNSEESNKLAKDITEFWGETIRRYPIDEHTVSTPALFRFTHDIRQRNSSGMINGRKKGELLSYGIMPCATPHKDSITSILLSCANVSVKHFPNGCPAMISLSRKDAEKEENVIALIKTFFEAGGFHLAVNVVDAKLLEKAKEHPNEHKDIMVKISGYSTHFTKIDEELQNAVIKRAERQEI